MKKLLDHLIKITPNGGIIDLETPPMQLMSNYILIFPVTTFQLLNAKLEHNLNENMDQSQVMGKSLFQLMKNQ